MSKSTSASGSTLTKAKCHHARLRKRRLRSGLQTVAELRGHVCVTAHALDLSGAWCQAEDVSFAPASSVKAKFISTRVLGNRQP